MNFDADIVIIGAGIVGLAIASETAKDGRDIFIFEREESFGLEQSSRNSEVIHAGVYYEHGSLKAKMCLEGNHLLYEICESNGIAYRKCGKIIVATNAAESEEMGKLYQQGRNNGIPLKMLSRKEMRELEPNMRGTIALLSPTTGIVDSHGLMRYFLGIARDGGAQLVCRTEVMRIQQFPGGYELRVREPSGQSSFKTRVVINCTGLHSDRVAEMAGIDIHRAGYKLHWCKGEYYSVGGTKNRRINHLIYPVPMSISVGVHVCLDVDWRLRLGPLFYYVNELNYGVNDSGRNAILESSIMKALPFIEPSDLEPETCGIMAMLQDNGEPFRDFIIKHEDERGLPGLINLIGIESPGMTSSPAIAKYVSRLVDDIIK